jgi:hypothetical protein
MTGDLVFRIINQFCPPVTGGLGAGWGTARPSCPLGIRVKKWVTRPDVSTKARERNGGYSAERSLSPDTGSGS